MSHTSLIGIRPLSYTKLLASGWLFILLYATLPGLMPMGFWFSIREVYVPSPVGENSTPVLMVNRTIKRDFSGRWTVAIRRVGQRGPESYCSASGVTNYTRDAVLPDPLTIDWWIWPTRCDLHPGNYRISTQWCKTTGWREVCTPVINSNIFKVQ